SVRTVVQLFNSGSLPQPSPTQIKSMVWSVRQLSRQEIGDGFALFNRDLLYDLKPFILAIMEEKINTKEETEAQILPASRLIQQTFNQLTVIDSSQIQQLQTEIKQLQAQINSLTEQLNQNSPLSQQINKQNKIKDAERQLFAKKRKLETIQQSSPEKLKENSAKSVQLLPPNLELEKLAQKLEQFDSKQQENK
ncbi:17050_t:CDS:2, partial [Funneliformis geosporum]